MGLTIADHEKSYTNHFYNSLYDNSSNIQYVYKNVSNDELIPKDSIQNFIAGFAEDFGKTVYQLITGNRYTGLENVSRVIVCTFLIGLYTQSFIKYLSGR